MRRQPGPIPRRRDHDASNPAEGGHADKNIVSSAKKPRQRRGMGHPDPMMKREHYLTVSKRADDAIIGSDGVTVQMEQLRTGEVRLEPRAEVSSVPTRRVATDLDAINGPARGQRSPRGRQGRGVDDDSVASSDEPAAEPSYALFESSDLRVEVRGHVVYGQ